MVTRPRPLALIILDGWGIREEKNANAVALANKPHWDYLWSHYAHTLISGCGKWVGLPDKQMGNSEVGHLNMGAGRIVRQDLTYIDSTIEDGSFFTHPILVNAIETTVKKHKALHILGLLSAGGVHSHEKHVHALLKLAALHHAEEVYLHLFLDGRDTPPKSAQLSIAALDSLCRQLQCGKIASIIGRYYAMDRDNRWERIQTAYQLITEAKADYHATDAINALQSAYDRGETDEFVKATLIGKTPPMQNGDTVIFMNFRADRARELTQAFINPDFDHFIRQRFIKLTEFVSLTEYDKTLKTTVVFSPEPLDHILAAYLSKIGLHQLRIAETEKYAHVTFFFNGGVEKPYPNEDRILVPSPKVATYDLKPEMSAHEITERLVNEINSDRYDVIICNYANADMVGHSGNLAATIQAIETLDGCLKKVIDALQAVGGEAIITADHGNAEMMFDQQTGQPHTAHTNEQVPFIYVGRPAHIIKTNGVLSDIAPTMLYLMGLTKPKEMTGESLIELK